MVDDAQQALSLSIVIPARIRPTDFPRAFELARAFLTELGTRAEVLVVDDGSEDTRRRWSRRRNGMAGSQVVAAGARRQGRGGAAGHSAGSWGADCAGRCRLFHADHGVCRSPPRRWETMTSPLLHVRLPAPRRYDEPKYRHIMGRVFNRLVQRLLLPGIRIHNAASSFCAVRLRRMLSSN